MNDKIKPPKLAERWFKWFCAEEYYEELQGDLEEAFYINVESSGAFKARIRYVLEVWLMLRPSVIKKIKGQATNSNNII